jgi:hypothetical protein
VPIFTAGEAAQEIQRVQVRGQTRALPSRPTAGALSSGGLY